MQGAACACEARRPVHAALFSRTSFFRWAVCFSLSSFLRCIFCSFRGRKKGQVAGDEENRRSSREQHRQMPPHLTAESDRPAASAEQLAHAAAMVRGYHTCTIHVWRMGRLNTTFGQNGTLYANYVPNLLRHGVLRDPNHSLRIEYTLQ